MYFNNIDMILCKYVQNLLNIIISIFKVPWMFVHFHKIKLIVAGLTFDIKFHIPSMIY